MKKKFYYEINIFNNGSRKTIYCLTEKEKNQWLISYFTVGEEKFWAMDKYKEYVEKREQKQKYVKSFNWFVKNLVKNRSEDLQSFIFRPHCILIINKKAVG